ncbi:MAG: hypothetical protein ACRCUY_08070 [Thermoguttaceae bacterium]
MNFFQAFYLSHFSTPKENRKLYQAISREKPTRILEFGIQRCQRSISLIELAKRHRKTSDIEYTCVDPFEDRDVTDGPGLSLRKGYRVLTQTEVKVRTIPGPPEIGLEQLVRQSQKFDWVTVATPSIHWIDSYRAMIANVMNENGIFFVGKTDESGRVFSFESFRIDSFRETSSPISILNTQLVRVA